MRIAPGLLLFVALLAPFGYGAGADREELRLVMVVSRHGVRPPTADANRAMGKYAAQPWPKWEVPDGYLTPHGKHLMQLMGEYYRAVYTREGLLTGDAGRDAARIFFRADSDERTIESALGLAAGLLPGRPVEVQALAGGADDPLFHSLMAHVGRPDLALAEAELRGRIGGDAGIPVTACGASLALLERVLLGTEGPPPVGKSLVSAEAARIAPDPRAGQMATLAGPLLIGHRCAEDFLLEYTDAKPAAEVGWGRVDRRTLEQLLALEAIYSDLTETAPYRARAQASNLASHLLATLEQGARDRPVPGAIGGPAARLVIVSAHPAL